MNSTIGCGAPASLWSTAARTTESARGSLSGLETEGQMSDSFPWEAPGRGTWRCHACGFESPMWDSADRIRLCVRCDQAARFEARAPLRESIEDDRRINARQDAVCVGMLQTIRETERAVLFEWPDGIRSWVPKSVIVDRDEIAGVFIKEWFYIKELEGVIGDAA
jgi:hypothetical protein